MVGGVEAQRHRTALVLSGGGARGAYEAGVVAALFERVLPRLPPGFEFDVVSGTSVGAIHAAYVAASSGEDTEARAGRLVETWATMDLADVFDLGLRDLLGIPLRALGLRPLRRPRPGRARAETVGGLVDVSPLERLVAERIPWGRLPVNLGRRRPGALCVSCTEVRSGKVTVFMDGPLADPGPWGYDPAARAIRTELGASHVRASAALPFLFPAVRIGDRYYVDGGLRMNTPLSPVLRLRAERLVVVALKHDPEGEEPAFPEEAITQPAFLIGKVLDALLLDQLEYELRRVGLVNAWIAHGTRVFGPDFLERINVAVREQRGVGFRHVEVVVIRPSVDIGRIAARCMRGRRARSLGLLPALLARSAVAGVPADEADLLSYLLFDKSFTRDLVELGRRDTAALEDRLVALLAPGEGV
jgi:NTE family protein